MMMHELDQRIDDSSIDGLCKRVSLVDGVPLLIFGQLSNLKEVQRCLQIITVIKFEGELAVKQHQDFKSFNKDPLELWKIVQRIHKAYISSANKSTKKVSMKDAQRSQTSEIEYRRARTRAVAKTDQSGKLREECRSGVTTLCDSDARKSSRAKKKSKLRSHTSANNTNNDRSKSRPGRDSKNAEPGEPKILTNNCSRSSRDSGEPKVLKLEDRVCYRCGERGHLRASCAVSSEKSADDSAVGANTNSYRRASEDTQRSGHPSKSENDHDDDNRTRANSDVRGPF